ncbi:MAG: hypothetical protein E6I85_02435 [Chloroflexi bacterium]|nr:MAG: hypothetical protein E6I85_02435 [Chloroflexota bacterium]
MFRKLAVAAVALLVGIAAAAGSLAYSSFAGSARTMDPAQAAAAFGSADRTRLLGALTRHELAAGQLIQRADVEAAGGRGGSALVAVPMKDLPPLRAGDHVDLFALVGSADKLVAEPFAWSVPVAAVTQSGLVLRVGERQELAFVYAAGTMRLAAVLSGSPQPPGGAGSISSPEQALEAAR